MKKFIIIIILVLSIFQLVVMAANIDIGNAAERRTTYYPSTSTVIIKTNPANATGKITSIEVYCYKNLVNFEVATFNNISGTNFTTIDYEYIGSVVAGAKRTFTVDIDVNEGNYLGYHFTGGSIDVDEEGGDGYWYFSSTDKIPCTNETFSIGSGITRLFSLYGTGATAEVGAEENAIFFGMAF